jgi:predicted nucleic acid-binding protein
MCLIVDVNLCHKVFCETPSADFAPIHRALFGLTPGLRARLVYGGKLREEYWRTAAIRSRVLLLDRIGRARKLADDEVDAEQARVEAEPSLTSDDPHILALARVGRVTVLCTLDEDLVTDFTNPQLVPGRGRVYQRKSHAHLVSKGCRTIAKSAR